MIEVGVDNPNASVMVVENAERFGLAQLHQLRGRVGRGADQSYCVLVGDPENERLKAMEATNDGFMIADEDMKIRGPGDVLGTDQSGFTLKVTNLIRDLDLIDSSRRIAANIIESDPKLEHHSGLKTRVKPYFKDGLPGLSG